ncbi:MAG: energy transducer TonB [Alphaproteobacteria bacterium]|nr:energy transducer TonB [Alphaproteobacteria bacterium]
MRNWLIASALLHVLIMLMLWLGLPQMAKPLPTPPVLIPVEIAELAQITAAKPEEKKEPTQEPKKEPPKPPEIKPEPPKPEPKPPAPPEPKPPEPQPKPPEPKTEPKAEPIPAPAIKPKPPEVKKVEPPKDALSSILKNVAKLKTEPKPEVKQQPTVKPAETAPAPTPPKPDTKATTAAPSAPLVADRLMISEEDALRRQIAGCWNVPVGARDIENTTVEIYIRVNPDRSLKDAIVVDQARMARDTFFRAVAESALRALRNPRCSPLALPPEKYQQWQEMIFNFNPKDML